MNSVAGRERREESPTFTSKQPNWRRIVVVEGDMIWIDWRRRDNKDWWFDIDKEIFSIVPVILVKVTMI